MRRVGLLCSLCLLAGPLRAQTVTVEPVDRRFPVDFPGEPYRTYVFFADLGIHQPSGGLGLYVLRDPEVDLWYAVLGNGYHFPPAVAGRFAAFHIEGTGFRRATVAFDVVPAPYQVVTDYAGTVSYWNALVSGLPRNFTPTRAVVDVEYDGPPPHTDSVEMAYLGAHWDIAPEPGTLLLLGTGLVGVVGVARRRRRRAASL